METLSQAQKIYFGVMGIVVLVLIGILIWYFFIHKKPKPNPNPNTNSNSSQKNNNSGKTDPKETNITFSGKKKLSLLYQGHTYYFIPRPKQNDTPVFFYSYDSDEPIQPGTDFVFQVRASDSILLNSNGFDFVNPNSPGVVGNFGASLDKFDENGAIPKGQSGVKLSSGDKQILLDSVTEKSLILFHIGTGDQIPKVIYISNTIPDVNYFATIPWESVTFTVDPVK